jgi:hypothetical protein
MVKHDQLGSARFQKINQAKLRSERLLGARRSSCNYFHSYSLATI